MQAKLVSTGSKTGNLQTQTWFINTEAEREAFVAALQQKGFWQHGLHRSSHTREELQGMPRFQNLLGPMYDGPGWIRYETKDANDILSF